MKYAIIADIHANLEALEAVLQDMKQQACTHTACLGDIVGYNASPKSGWVELRRVDYDIPGALGKIDAAGLPKRFR